jgi:hypothetical protein
MILGPNVRPIIPAIHQSLRSAIRISTATSNKLTTAVQINNSVAMNGHGNLVMNAMSAGRQQSSSASHHHGLFAANHSSMILLDLRGAAIGGNGNNGLVPPLLPLRIHYR